MTGPNIQELQESARQIRRRLVRMSHDARAPHLGSALSCVELLLAAYTSSPDQSEARAFDQEDRVILSKGHGAATLYAVLAELGRFPEEWLSEYGRDGSRMPEQMAPGCLPGVELATGSLGHGLPVGAGMALASKIRKDSSKVTVILSDGECNEGSVWEAAMFASGQNLGSLTAIVDFNGWQATGRSESVLGLSPLAEKWKSFGWTTRVVDGHDLHGLTDALQNTDGDVNRPLAIVARTVKGRGVSFMEDDNNWHYRVPSEEELAAALAELETP